MDGRFFSPAQADNHSALREFLTKFPAEEIWRLFVERPRYDRRPQLLAKFKEELKYVGFIVENKFQYWQQLSDQAQHDFLKNLSIKDLLAIGKLWSCPSIVRALSAYVRKDTSRLNECVMDVLLASHYWLGFEKSEPGYLAGVVKGLCFILQALKDETPFNVEFIKRLHFLCTSEVKNMHDTNKPGEFRQKGIMWALLADCDTHDGILENLRYIQSHPDNQLLACIVQTPQAAPATAEEFEKLTKALLAALKEPSGATWHARMKTSVEETATFLDQTINALIMEYETSLKLAKTEDEKLHCIFDFLKKSVFNHCFGDGVGRVFSMIIILYLCFRANLTPPLFHNSNCIPGWSLQELIAHYKLTAIEMKKVYDSPAYLGSPEFCQAYNGVNKPTKEILAELTAAEQAYFKETVETYKKTRAVILAPKGIHGTLAANPGVMLL